MRRRDEECEAIAAEAERLLQLTDDPRVRALPGIDADRSSLESIARDARSLRRRLSLSCGWASASGVRAQPPRGAR